MTDGDEDVPLAAPEPIGTALSAAWNLGMPMEASAVHARWWQLENWLRSLVYIELKGKFGPDWEKQLDGGRSGRHQGNEEHFDYMAAPDIRDRLAFADVSELLNITTTHWDVFRPVLPELGVWQGKIVELKAVRNRIGHCRKPHADDLSRLEQTLRDLTRGAFRAAASFNDQSAIRDAKWQDPVTQGWVGKTRSTGVRLIDHADQQYKTTFELLCSKRPWVTTYAPANGIAGQPGFIWHAFWYFRGGRNFDLRRFWKQISSLSKVMIWVCMDGPSSLNVSFSALEDPETVSEVVDQCFDAALTSILMAPEADYGAWVERYRGLDPQIQVDSVWAVCDPKMPPTISMFGA
jgi:hypothetical protein